MVTRNKIACSSAYSEYSSLKSLARKFNAQFLFETNVGAGLPVINTLNDSAPQRRQGYPYRRCCQPLNFVFNKYDIRTFAEVAAGAGRGLHRTRPASTSVPMLRSDT